jgi:hypothetical protein
MKYSMSFDHVVARFVICDKVFCYSFLNML